MAHETIVRDGENPYETGKRVSYLRYDSMAELLNGFIDGMELQAIKDGEKNRKQLESLGNEVAEKIKEVNEMVEKMWRISKPYMRDELGE